MEWDLVLVYSSLIRSVLEYASPVWANFLEYLSLVIEGVQKKALEIIFPGLPYRAALVHCGRCAQLCPMNTIYVQAPSERTPPWPLITVSINLLPKDIVS